MKNKTLNELVKQRQNLIREIDSKKEGKNTVELNSKLELVTSKIEKRQKELQFKTGGIKMEDNEPVKEIPKKVESFTKDDVAKEAENVMKFVADNHPDKGDNFTYKVALKIYSTLRRVKKEAQ